MDIDKQGLKAKNAKTDILMIYMGLGVVTDEENKQK